MGKYTNNEMKRTQLFISATSRHTGKFIKESNELKTSGTCSNYGNLEANLRLINKVWVS